MKVTFRLATVLAHHAGSNKVIDFELEERDDLASAIDALDERFPGMKSVLCGKGFEIVGSINIYLNEVNVRYMEGLNTRLKKGDVVNVIPAAAAG